MRARAAYARARDAAFFVCSRNFLHRGLDAPAEATADAPDGAQAACIKEIGMSKNFDENWGFLRARPEDCKPRAFETRLVKYFSNGVASVREKRLALEGEARGDTPPTPDEDKVRVDPEVQARAVAKSMFSTSSNEYGSRGSLELFGVAQVMCRAARPWSCASPAADRVGPLAPAA